MLSFQGFIPPHSPSHSDIQLVAELIILGTRPWNHDLLHVFFYQQTASSIQQIHLSASPTEDTAIWAKNPSGKFSVKLAYLVDQEARFTSSGPLSKKDWSKLWALKINEQLKLFLWKIAWDSLPIKEFLCRRICHIDSICPRCHGSQESIVRIFFECPFANIIWRHLSHPLNISNIPPRLALEWIQLILNPSTHLGLNPQDAHTFTLLAAITCD